MSNCAGRKTKSLSRPHRIRLDQCNSTLCNDTFRSLTPRFTLAWQTTDDLTTYANIAKGTKPGDFNSSVPDESYRVVDEETLWSYELGLKADLLEDRLILMLAAYYLEVDDQQVTSLVELDTGGTASILVNAGETSAYGIEAEIQADAHRQASHCTPAMPGPVRNSTTTSARKKPTCAAAMAVMPIRSCLGDVSGKDSPRVPEHMASLAARYQRALTADTQWYTAADWTYESSKYAQEHNLIETGDRQLVGLQTGLQQGRWDASLWVRNLFDDDTPADVIRYFDGRSGKPAAALSATGQFRTTQPHPARLRDPPRPRPPGRYHGAPQVLKYRKKRANCVKG